MFKMQQFISRQNRKYWYWYKPVCKIYKCFKRKCHSGKVLLTCIAVYVIGCSWIYETIEVHVTLLFRTVVCVALKIVLNTETNSIALNTQYGWWKVQMHTILAPYSVLLLKLVATSCPIMTFLFWQIATVIQLA